MVRRHGSLLQGRMAAWPNRGQALINPDEARESPDTHAAADFSEAVQAKVTK